MIEGQGGERERERVRGAGEPREREPDRSLKCMNLRHILNHPALFTSHCLPVRIHTHT